MLKLFIELFKGDIFHFHDKPERKLMKSDSSHYIAPEGRRVIHPFVLIFKDKFPTRGNSYYDQKKGDSDGRPR